MLATSAVTLIEVLAATAFLTFLQFDMLQWRGLAAERPRGSAARPGDYLLGVVCVAGGIFQIAFFLNYGSKTSWSEVSLMVAVALIASAFAGPLSGALCRRIRTWAARRSLWSSAGSQCLSPRG